MPHMSFLVPNHSLLDSIDLLFVLEHHLPVHLRPCSMLFLRPISSPIPNPGFTLGVIEPGFTPKPAMTASSPQSISAHVNDRLSGNGAMHNSKIYA